jgi:hypothetical protein
VTAEVLTAIGSLTTCIVIGASAVAALIQLRHMRVSNQLEALLSLERDFRSDEIQYALRYVQDELPARLEDRQYRDELAAIGFVDPRVHPEIVLCNWFSEIGTLLKHGLVTEPTFMDMFGRLIAYYWILLEPVVAVMRRNRGDAQYHGFEFLALRARLWLERYPNGIFPHNAGRATLHDRWREADLLSGSVPLRGEQTTSR